MCSKIFVCKKCGHQERSDNKFGVRCTKCGNHIWTVKKNCTRCGQEYIGTAKTVYSLCPACITDDRVVHSKYLRQDKSPYDELVDLLCSNSPAQVHPYMQQEAACREELARRIAYEAKTAQQAREMIKQANDDYIHSNKQSYGIAQYGGFE